MTEETLVVKHNTDGHEFYMTLNNGEKAKLEYEWVREGIINLYHTEVPVSCRGKGLAQLLAKAALDYVITADAKMILSCTYLEKYVKDNPLPEYTSRLEVSSSL